ncbi:MAG: PAS domain S-box protein [Pseudanabaenaceae cyanobacterium bins.39]|nr:PAS domain S-box protein [Pseudanabaenaceae cyanobacterium bins.39]
MQSILDHISCGVFALEITEKGQDLNPRFAIANQAFMDLVQPNVNLIHRPIFECLPLEFAQLLSQQVEQCYQTQKNVEFIAPIKSDCILKISLSYQLDHSSETSQIIGTCQNCSDLSYNINTLDRSLSAQELDNRKFSHLIGAVAEAFVVVDQQGIVRYINKAAEKLFGRTAENIIGKTFGLPVVSGDHTNIDILNNGSIVSAEMRVSEVIAEDRMIYVLASLRDIAARKQVEESLQLRERAITASSNGIVITDATQPDNPVIYVNPSFERITGYKANEVIGRNCRFLQGQERSQISTSELRKAINAKKECHAVLLNYRKNGTPFWNDLYISPVFNEQGELTNYIGIQTDITEQVKSTHRLLESEERLRTVLTSIKEGITFSDDMGYFSIFNPGMEALTGYTMAEANASGDFSNFLYPDRSDHDKALLRLQHLQEAGRVATVETRIRHRDGTYKDVLVSTRMMIYKGKRMYLSSYYDITERKQVETQLRYQSERERLLNAVLLKIQCEVNLDQILAITVKEAQELLKIDRVVIYKFQEDWGGQIVVESVNDPALSILGKTVNDCCFQHKYMQQNQIVSHFDNLELVNLSDCHRELLESFHIKANIAVSIAFGGSIWGLLIAHQCFEPRHWQDFEVELFTQLANHVAIAIQQVQLFERVQDLNKNLERQVAERTQQLERSLSQLERALLKEKELNELKSQFISRASHEFRTPLTTIQTASDLLRNYGHKMTEEKKLERIDKIQREVKSMTNLLEEVLIIGKTEANKFKLNVEEVKLVDFCLESIEQTKFLGNGKHQIVFQNINAPDTIQSDPKFLRQIISNLLSNAIKYSPNGGEVRFTVSVSVNKPSQLILEFQDHGIGIPVEDQEKIFDHFYRARNVGVINGTGLGMAIIKNSVDILSGTIKLTSTENIGTHIKVFLPISFEKI